MEIPRAHGLSFPREWGRLGNSLLRNHEQNRFSHASGGRLVISDEKSGQFQVFPTRVGSSIECIVDLIFFVL